MIKDNGFENNAGNGELEEELIDALHKKGLIPDGEEEAASAGEGAEGSDNDVQEPDGEAQNPGDDVQESDGEAQEDSEPSLEEFLSEDEEPAEGEEGQEETAEAPEDGKKNKKKAKKANKTGKRFNSRRLRYGGMATAVTAAVVALVIVLNVVVDILADRYPLNLDLTQDKLFTLTENSVDIARSIDKEVEVIVFANEEYFKSPPSQLAQYGDLFREFDTAMQQYNSYSGGNVTVQYLDLNANPTLSTTYEKYDPAEFDAVFICGDRYKKVNVLEDMLVQESDYYTGSYSYTSKVEVTIASQMKNVTNDNPVIVSVFTGHSEMEGAVDALRELYELNGYEFQEVNLASDAEIDENSTVGLIAAPANDFTQAEVEKLQRWMDNDGNLGRNLLVFAHPNGNCPELYNFLEVEYGIEVTGNLIVETDVNRTYMYNGYNSYADLADSDYTTDITGEANVLATQTVQLLTHFESDTSLSSYNQDIMTFPESAKLISAADASSGEEAEPQTADEYPLIGMASSSKYTYIDNEKAQNNVVVCGSIYMVSYASNPNLRNEDILLNAMNVMTGQEDTIDVSTKSLDQETIEFSDSTALVVGLGVFTIGIPVVILIICLIVFLRRRHL